MEGRGSAQRAVISLESESETEFDSEDQALLPKREVVDIESDYEQFDFGDPFSFNDGSLAFNGDDFDEGDMDGEEAALPRTPTDLRQTHLDGRPCYDICHAEILEVFPEISHAHVRKLYDAHVLQNNNLEIVGIGEEIILKILDENIYPKEKDIIREKKRKRSKDLDTDEEEAARWKDLNRGGERVYLEIARQTLVDEFPSVPVRFIESSLRLAGNLYAAYVAIELSEYNYPDNKDRSYARLKTPRKPKPLAFAKTHPIAVELTKEIEAARNHRDKEHAKRQLQKDAAEAEALTDKEYRDNGDVLDCQCCFDSYTINKITHCDGDEPHFFCLECAERNAKNEIGNSRHNLKCMDFSGCTASFSRDQKQRFLDDKSFEALERIQQQAELNQAELANLYRCPFCDFAAICPPVNIDKEFRCRNPGCEKVTCRLCKLDSHIPLSCQESKKENGISERHIVEEARTQALLRVCPKCNVKILKEDGCNKVTCTCGGMLCDYCGKDISKDGYAHFDSTVEVRPHRMAGSPGRGKKCPTYDNFQDRRTKELEKAETQAREKIRLENPEIDAEDLKIKFKETTKSPPRRPGPPQPVNIGRHMGHRPIPRPQYPVLPFYPEPLLMGDFHPNVGVGGYIPLPPGMRPNIPPLDPINVPQPLRMPHPNELPRAADQAVQQYNNHQNIRDAQFERRQAMMQHFEDRITAELAQEVIHRRVAPGMRNFGPDGQAG